MPTRRAPSREPRPPAKVRARRRAMAGLVVGVLFVGVLLFGVFPTRQWFDQRRETADAEAELAAVRAERAEVAKEQERLQTPEEIERIAREDFGMVEPGEEAYNILPAPVDPIGLPEGWPFTGVERAFGAG
ncbi:MAG: septum formation initiator family protein [Acidimicrobiales bacterium]|nr:septum formation initiator family protein [Acidimicrobiales bacterium]HRW39675.1 septum formation initiator family protein [Aquihabitans sp.]